MGWAQIGPLPEQSLTFLRAHSSSTPPDAQAYAHDLFDGPTMAVLHQAHKDEKPLRCIKLVDGFAIVTAANKVVSVISDKRMCQTVAPPPVHITVAHHDKPSYFFSQVHRPYTPPINAMYLVNHSRVTAPNEVSRYTTVNGFAAKFTAHIPLETVPRVLMSSHSMGKAEGRVIAGDDADFLKEVYLSAALQGGGDPYHKPVSISDAVGGMLMIKNTAKPILCTRIKDGIVGYRARNDGKHSFVFVAHSADMDHDAPMQGAPVKVVKVTYNSDSLSAPRLMVNPAGGGGSGGDITPDMSVAEVLDKMSHKFNETNIHAMGCNDYERLCAISATGDQDVWKNHAAAFMMGGAVR